MTVRPCPPWCTADHHGLLGAVNPGIHRSDALPVDQSVAVRLMQSDGSSPLNAPTKPLIEAQGPLPAIAYLEVQDAAATAEGLDALTATEPSALHDVAVALRAAAAPATDECTETGTV